MGKIWLVTCDNGSIAWLRAEVGARDAAPRFLRCTDGANVPKMARLLTGEVIAAALQAEMFEGPALEETISEMAQEGLATDMLVFTASVDPGSIARWFYAGATEVIAAGDVEVADSSESISMSCMGREPSEVNTCGAPAGDDRLVPEGRRAAAGPGMPRAKAGADAAALCDELDEPPHHGGAEEDGSAIFGSSSSDARGSEARAPVPVGGAVRRAPLVTVVSGSGGSGKTTLVAAMAACAARTGLRAAVLDFDLMFGNLPAVFGVGSIKGLELVGAHATDEGLVEEDIENAAMRVGPGLTLWGPCSEPERAELVSTSAERLVEVLRGVADVIFVDTSAHWGDAVAMAVASCDRCLVVGSAGIHAAASAKHVIGLVARLGVPMTKMAFVFNRYGARGCGEDQALNLEMEIALSSRTRVSDGGDEVENLSSFEQVDALVMGNSAFARDVSALTCEMLRELGCPVEAWLLEASRSRGRGMEKMPLRLPWKRKAGDE